jgi:hypothetical protein
MHRPMKECLKEGYILRVILEAKLSVRNEITAIGALDVPGLRYNFGTHYRHHHCIIITTTMPPSSRQNHLFLT